MLDGPAVRSHLKASYFDTPEGSLARHGIVVRLRKEGMCWVQTAKGPTADVLERLEHNAELRLQPSHAAPVIDLSRHRGTPIGKLIDKALSFEKNKTYPSLALLYCTDIRRIVRQMTSGDSVVEVTLDQGIIFHGDHSQDVCELEIELKEGLPLDAINLARKWCAAHGLWISSISKSMKGQRLNITSAKVCAKSPNLPTLPTFTRHATAQDMITSVVQACLNQILPNMSELAWGSNSPAHIHQLRVGIRRLRTVFCDLGDLTCAPDPAWEVVLTRIFRILGTHRDHSYLGLVLQPEWLLAGGPIIHFDSAGDAMPDLVRALIAPEVQQTMLGLLAFAHREAPQVFEKPGSLKKMMSKRLGKLHARALRDGNKFSDLGQAQRHHVRKRFKRLRYLVEFTAPLFVSRKAQSLLTAIRPLQDALGAYNDEMIAFQALTGLASVDAKAWFGAGWLAARREPNTERCLQEIKKFAKLRPFW